MKHVSGVFIVLAVAVLVVACASPPPPAAVASPQPVEDTPAPAPAPAPEPPKFREVVTNEALPLTIKTFYPNGDSSGSITNKYNDKGYLVLQETTNPNGVLVESRSGKAKGDVWRITVTNAQTGEILSFEDRVYSSEGDLLSQTYLNPKEVPQSANEYVYIEGRKVSWVAKLGAGGSTQAKTLYVYDSSGNNVKVEVYDAGNKLITVYENSFDANGHLSSTKGVDTDKNLIEQTNFTWNGDQKIRQETVKPLLRTLDFTYADNTTAPSGISSSVRGKLVEKQLVTYTWIKRIHRVAIAPTKESK